MMAKTRQPGWWYPWIFVCGMLVVIVVNGFLVMFAVGTFSGIATKDHYRKGLAYNEAIAGAKAQQERGWQMNLSYAPEAQTNDRRHGQLVVMFTDREGQPLGNLDVKATLFRPTHEGFDQTVSLDHRGAGAYGAMLTVPLAGQWEARVRARGYGDTFQMNRRIIVP